jgi:feruloyl-CoA synthase
VTRLLETNPGSTLEVGVLAPHAGHGGEDPLHLGLDRHAQGVINTHRMLCANQQMLAQVWPFLEDRTPVIVDWLPWNHTFGGNFCFNLMLRNGGTLYIDNGKPAPGLAELTRRTCAKSRRPCTSTCRAASTC